jgi:EAL domain
MDVQCIAAAFKISRWPCLISCRKDGLPNGFPKLSMTSVLAEALPQEDPQVTKATFSIRRTTCRANGIRQFYLEAGTGPPVILLHGFPETSFAWSFQITALARHYRVIALFVASLSYLKKFPLDGLKIDRSFVRDLLTDPDDAAIVNSTILLSRQLGLSVIAEGIENRATADLLATMSCKEGQGYFFGRPMPVFEFERRYLESSELPFRMVARQGAPSMQNAE